MHVPLAVLTSTHPSPLTSSPSRSTNALTRGAPHSKPRLGQGAFRLAFQSVHEALVGTPYPYVQYGKPTTATYKLAEKVLRDRLEELAGERVDEMPRVYMVGDNPESDISGANGAGWPSILVKTGVYEEARGPPTHAPPTLPKTWRKQCDGR